MQPFTWRAHGTVRLAAVAAFLVALAGCSSDKSGGSTPDGGPPVWTISGTVVGAVVQGVTVKVQGGTRQAVTNAQGAYTIRGLYDGTYTLEASLEGYSIVPPTRTVAVAGANVTGQDFTVEEGLSIAGQVTGSGSAGVTLTLVGPEPLTSTRTATTDATGAYRFRTVGSGAYLVTPSLAGGWTFSPANMLVTVGTTSVTGASFASIPANHAISGRITGADVVGVVVTLSGGVGAVAVTDGAGGYVFTNLPPGTYDVTPSRPGSAFSPRTRSVTLAGADATGADFTSAATHRISGRISGDVLEGARVSLSGAATGTAATDASGYFEFTDLRDGIYTVTPSLDGFAFAPLARSVTLSGADATGADFVAASAASYTVSGAVSPALAGASITLAGDATFVTTTDAAGAFRFQGVGPGTYLLAPSHDDYTFAPASRLVVVTADDVGAQTFTAAVNPTARTILGTVGGAVDAGVSVSLVGPSPSTSTRYATTDAMGQFVFRHLADGSYLATPSLSGFAFSPANCLVTIAGPSVTFVEFTSAVSPHAISGTIAGAVVAGVPVHLAGAGVDRTSVTDADGSYAFAGLVDGEYAVSPTLAGYWFSPVQAAVTLAGANVTGVNFVSAPSHGISGHVTGDVLGGVQLALAGPSADATLLAVTDGAGAYAFTALRSGRYVVTPSLSGFAFEPQFLPVDLAGTDVVTADFTATAIPTYSVSGTISGATVAGVQVGLSGIDPALSTTTDAGGAYSFTGLPDGGSYMLIPAAGGYDFTPASRAFRIDGASVTGQDFTSAVAP